MSVCEATVTADLLVSNRHRRLSLKLESLWSTPLPQGAVPPREVHRQGDDAHFLGKGPQDNI